MTTIEPISSVSGSHLPAVFAHPSQNEQEHGHKSSLRSENLESSAAKSLQKCVDYKKTMRERDDFKEKSQMEKSRKAIVNAKDRFVNLGRDKVLEQHKCLDVPHMNLENEFKKPIESIWYVRVCFDTF